jgi:acetyl esterase/lipase
MTAIDRRDFGRLGIGAMVAALAARGGIALAAPSPVDPLAYVAPELQPSARELMNSRGTSDWTRAGLMKMRASGGQPVAPRLPDVPVVEFKVPVGQGQPDVTVFVINARPGARRPGILHTHGGGYILGSAASEIAYEQALARELDCVIVTVEYRLAPETTYVGSVEDNYAGLRWMHGQADRFGIDPARIVVMGESAGGGHAARLAITARDRKEVPLAAQILIYPMLDDRTGSTVALPPFIGAVLWTPAANRLGWESFLGMAPGGPDVPAAGVPARVADLSGLPPAFIGVGGVDLFVREDLDYARRLTEAGVPTELVLSPGGYHAFDRIAPDTEISRRFTKAKLNALRKAFGQPVVE